MITAEQADTLSRARARRSRLRITVLAVLVVFALVVFSLALQRSQNDLNDYVHEMCNQRAANVKISNARWHALAEIERTNQFIDEKIRQARLDVYEGSRLTVPNCNH